MKAYVFPGQGSQFTGMGKDIYDANPTAKRYFDQANDILGFDITSIMFTGSADELKQTKVTQPAIFYSFGSTRAFFRNLCPGYGGRPFARRIFCAGGKPLPFF